MRSTSDKSGGVVRPAVSIKISPGYPHLFSAWYNSAMKGSLVYGKKGEIESPRSNYQPSIEVRELTQKVKGCVEEGENNLNHPYDEYNGRSFVTQTNEAQRTWLAHPDTPYTGDDEWRFNGIRPITRNRVVYTTARLTAQLLWPKSHAQNSMDEEDIVAGQAMDGLLEYNIGRSNYETAFLMGVLAGLVNPINYFSVEYCESWQEAWQGGEYKRVIDEVFSGFQYGLVPIDEMYFANPYVYEWQKQDWIIRTRRVSYEEMEGRFGKHENWGHVTIGRTSMVNMDGFFYDVEDINDGLVGHVSYKHRRSDCEIDFVNGIYVSNPNTKFNPFLHRRMKTVDGEAVEIPLYDTVKFGFEPIDAMRFVGYKSLVDKMSNDQDAADREWQDYFDASRLATFTPVVTMGAGKIDKSVVSPAGVTELGKDAKTVPLQVANPVATLGALREAERSANETSVDPQTGGIQQGPQKTKAEVDTLEQNTDTNLSLTAKLIATMVKEAGHLMADDIIRFQTVGEAGEILGDTVYRTFIIDGKLREGREKTTRIKFTDRFAGRAMSKEERETEEYKLMEEAGEDKDLIEVNPGVFSRMNWLFTIDAEQMTRRNTQFERQFKLAAYDRAIRDPLVQQDPESQLKITRDFLFAPIFKGEAAKYLPRIRKVAEGVTGYPQPNAGAGKVPAAPAVGEV